MIKAFSGGLLVLLLAGSTVWAAASIDVGTHYLEPGMAGQTFEIFVTTTSAETVGSLNLYAQVGNGGPEAEAWPTGPAAGTGVDGPAITGVDVLAGTIIGNVPHLDPMYLAGLGTIVPQVFNSAAGTDYTPAEPFDEYNPLPAPEVPADGLLATVELDTTGFASGSWDFFLSDSIEGPTKLYHNQLGVQTLPEVPLTIVDGTVAIASTLNSVTDGPWSLDSTWDDPPTVPFAGTKTVVNHAVDVAADGNAFSLDVGSGAVTVEPDNTLTIDHGANVGSGTVGINLGGDGSGVLANAMSGKLVAESVQLDTGSKLEMEALGFLGDLSPVVGEWGLLSLDIIEGSLSGTFGSVPSGLLGYGVFLENLDDSSGSVVVADLLQAAPGDANGDRQVDAGDIEAILAANKFMTGQPADWSDGDFTGDGFVDAGDIEAILAANLFMTGPYVPPKGASGAYYAKIAVPEPSTVVMLVAGGLGVLLALWRRRRKA